jgi:TIR domain-containing protein
MNGLAGALFVPTQRLEPAAADLNCIRSAADYLKIRGAFMSYLDEFKRDVFISYAHYDNEPLIEGKEGWVSEFHRKLEIYLRKRLGVDPVIWRDNELRGNEYLWDKLKNEISKVAVLIPIVSPRYLNSKSCLDELKAFCEAAEEAGGLRVADDKARVFKVLQMPIPLEEHPPEVKEFIGYEFFQVDVMTGRPREFDPALGQEAEQKFLLKVGDVASDIVKLLDLLKRHEGGKAAPKTGGPIVFLAETTSDQAGERDEIRRELQERGCTILPNKPLLAATDFAQAVTGDLERAQFSIHIIGQNYGIIPEKADRSVVDLQDEFAVQRGCDPAFTRIIWLPPGITPEDERQRKFIEYLKADPRVQENVEFIEGSLDKLKTCIKEKVQALSRPPPAPVVASDEGPLRIYVICDQADRNAAEPIAAYLFNEGFEAILPPIEGDEAQLREDHKDNLMTCDAALIYHGSASEIWLRTKRSDLKKAAGFNRVRPMLCQAIYLGAPETPQKASFRTHEAEVIRMFGAFSGEALNVFISKLKTQHECRVNGRAS